MEPVTLASAILPVGPAEAVDLERDELRRFIETAQRLPETAWDLRSARSGHDLRALLAHVAGTYAAQARLGELRRQLNPQLLRFYHLDGESLPETFVRLQAGDRSGRTEADLLAELELAGQAAIQRRALVFRPLVVLGRAPVMVDRVPAPPLAPFRAVRDLWGHRLDLLETTGEVPRLDSSHDGRIVEGILRSRASGAQRLLGRQSVDILARDPHAGRWRFGSPSQPGATIELDGMALVRLLLAWRSPAATRERSRIDGDVRLAMALLAVLHGGGVGVSRP